MSDPVRKAYHVQVVGDEWDTDMPPVAIVLRGEPENIQGRHHIDMVEYDVYIYHERGIGDKIKIAVGRAIERKANKSKTENE